MNKVKHPFWVIVHKEIADHVHSLRFIILISIIVLTCMGALYTALTNIGAAIKPDDPDGSFLFLKLFTVSDGTLPSFVLFINFLGPLLGIALGFDAVNSEQNKGTLSRMLAQPIHRDCIINAKFVAALIIIGALLFALGLLVMGCGLIAIGIPPTPEEFWRIILFIITGIFYVAFWLNISILFSLCFRQAATSALASVAVWLFFSVFYAMIVNVVAKALSPSGMVSVYHQISYQKFILGLMRLAPSELFNEATTTLLMPSIRSLGPLTMEQLQGAIPSPLPLGESIMIVWSQLTGLIAATVVCFAISYIVFMRGEKSVPDSILIWIPRINRTPKVEYENFRSSVCIIVWVFVLFIRPLRRQSVEFFGFLHEVVVPLGGVFSQWHGCVFPLLLPVGLLRFGGSSALFRANRQIY